jgi:thiamine biosynthesis lipoprotein
MSPVAAPIIFPALGTTAVIIVADEAASAAALVVVEAQIASTDRACSRFRPDSELSRLNSSPGTTVTVSAELFDAIEVALDAARATDGLVDPTVGHAMRILGYDRDFSQIDKAAGPLRVSVGPVPGWRLISLDRERRRIRVPPGVELDLGATAKAGCADRAAESAFAATGCGVLVSLGGDVAVAGPAPEGGWTVLVTDDHAAPLDSPGQRIAIAAGGLATSGTTVRRWARGGRQLHHLIDPATAMPVDSVWRTVSVAAHTCVAANTASTAAMILGAAGPDWLAARSLPARLVRVDGTVTTVAGWPAPPNLGDDSG